MDLQLLIVEKLFKAFSEITVELMKSSNIDENTKSILCNNIASISSILFTNNKSSIENVEARVNTPPSRRTRTKRRNNDLEAGSNPKVLKTDSNFPSLAAASSHQVIRQAVLPPPVASVDLTTSNPSFELCAIAPEKKVFVSNFPTNTTVAEIQGHLKKSITENGIASINIEKIEPKVERSTYSSFIINAFQNVELFNLLVDSKLWPIHTVVHEFNNSRRKSNFQSNRKRQRRT